MNQAQQRTERRRASRVGLIRLLLVGFFMLTGCNTVAPSDKRIPLTAADNVLYSTIIRTALASDEPKIDVNLAALDFDTLLYGALEKVGALRRVRSGHYRFTTFGIAASTMCGFPLNRLVHRCFAVAHDDLMKIDAVTEIPVKLDTGAARNYWFSFRAEPVGIIGRRLAAAKSLVCTDATGNAVRWNGKGVYYSTLSVSLDQGTTVAQSLESFCPRSVRGPSPETPAAVPQ